jgi:hypothetical protein
MVIYKAEETKKKISDSQKIRILKKKQNISEMRI